MTSPATCGCGTVHANGCPGRLAICFVPGYLFEWEYTNRNPQTGAVEEWPEGTTARIRFSWGTGTELVIPAVVIGAELTVFMTGAETEQIPRGSLATIDLNYDAGDPDMWRPWRQGHVSRCK